MSWIEASRGDRCPICDHANWCQVSSDGIWVVCRRQAPGAIKEVRDKNGELYFVHRLDGRRTSPVELADLPPPGPSVKRADDDTLDRVYRDLQRRMPLAAHHREHLRQRGLTDQQITVAGYRTLPGEGRSNIVGEPALRFPGLDPATVPGLFRNTFGRWTLACRPGLLIPVRDVRRRLIAWQVRPDDPGEGGKYRWLSSKHRGGSSSGVRGHVPGWINQPAPLVRLVEGPLKADVCTVLSGVPTIGFPGAGLWCCCLPALQELGCQEVLLAFDRDWRENPAVARGLVDCFHALQRKGYAVAVEVW